MQNNTYQTNLRQINLTITIDNDGNVNDVSKSNFIDRQDEMDKRIIILEEQFRAMESQFDDIRNQRTNEIKKEIKNKVSEKRKTERNITVSELKKRLGIGDHTAYNLLDTGEIFAFRTGNAWKIPESSIGEYIKRNSNRQ